MILKSLIANMAILHISSILVSSAQEERNTGFPFQYVMRERIVIVDALTQQDDLRELFCDIKILKDRVQRKVAILDMQGFLLKGDEEVVSKVCSMTWLFVNIDGMNRLTNWSDTVDTGLQATAVYQGQTTSLLDRMHRISRMFSRRLNPIL
jgi:hypothetical protein